MPPPASFERISANWDLLRLVKENENLEYATRFNRKDLATMIRAARQAGSFVFFTDASLG